MHSVLAKGILSSNNGFNLYRGCTHGCIYCDSRSRCYQMNHAFEDIEVKENAPVLLERALKKKRKPCMLSTGAMCDPYMPCEEELNLTRRCLEIIKQYRFGVCIQTKSDRILRDIDLLDQINQQTKCVVQMTLTTYDEQLCSIIEPDVASTHRRYEVLKIMQAKGIPTVVWIAPILPYINDTEANLRGILDYCIDAGVKGILCFGMGTTMRDGSRDYFYQALDHHFPRLKHHYIKTFGGSYICPSPNEKQLMRIFHTVCASHHIMHDVKDVFNYMATFSSSVEQLTLF